VTNCDSGQPADAIAVLAFASRRHTLQAFGISSERGFVDGLTRGDRRSSGRWAARAGTGTVGASYLPACPARLAAAPDAETGAPPDWPVARARLALLWTERAAALRYRRAVLRMDARSVEQRLELARLQREAFAYDAGAARLRTARSTTLPWLIRHLGGRGTDRVVGPTFTTLAAELAILHLAHGGAGAATVRDSPVAHAPSSAFG
jgi:hypothetical protein